MSGVPPIGAFPQTPVTLRRGPAARAPPTTPPPQRKTSPKPLPVAPQQRPSSANSSPVIPLNILDAPTQRLYALGVYTALFAWKFYDWAQLVEEETESFWMFLKWLAIDFVFLFGLPELRIPWLELSQLFVVVAFFFHAIFDWMLMFNIGVCLACGMVCRVGVADTLSVSLANMDLGFLQSVLRSRGRHLGAQCQDFQHHPQLVAHYGQADH
jgi:nucleoporin POM152